MTKIASTEKEKTNLTEGLKHDVLTSIRSNYKPLTFHDAEYCDFPGVYAIWFRHRCLYVGKSAKQAVAKRLYRHISRCHNPELKLWIHVKRDKLNFTTTAIADERSISLLEIYLIDSLKPETNKTFN